MADERAWPNAPAHGIDQTVWATTCRRCWSSAATCYYFYSRLVEQMHLVFFDKGIVGGEFNFSGPRPSRLADYLEQKVPSFHRISLDILLNRDSTEQLAHLQAVRLIDLRLRKDYVDVVADADESIPGAIRSTLDGMEAGTVELLIRPPRRHSLTARALQSVRSLAANARTNEGAEKFRFAAETIGRMKLP